MLSGGWWWCAELVGGGGGVRGGVVLSVGFGVVCLIWGSGVMVVCWWGEGAEFLGGGGAVVC